MDLWLDPAVLHYSSYLCCDDGWVQNSAQIQDAFCALKAGDRFCWEKNQTGLWNDAFCKYPVRGEPQGLVVSALETQGCLSSFDVLRKFTWESILQSTEYERWTMGELYCNELLPLVPLFVYKLW